MAIFTLYPVSEKDIPLTAENNDALDMSGRGDFLYVGNRNTTLPVAVPDGVNRQEDFLYPDYRIYKYSISQRAFVGAIDLGVHFSTGIIAYMSVDELTGLHISDVDGQAFFVVVTGVFGNHEFSAFTEDGSWLGSRLSPFAVTEIPARIDATEDGRAFVSTHALFENRMALLPDPTVRSGGGELDGFSTLGDRQAPIAQWNLPGRPGQVGVHLHGRYLYWNGDSIGRALLSDVLALPGGDAISPVDTLIFGGGPVVTSHSMYIRGGTVYVTAADSSRITAWEPFPRTRIFDEDPQDPDDPDGGGGGLIYDNRGVLGCIPTFTPGRGDLKGVLDRMPTFTLGRGDLKGVLDRMPTFTRRSNKGAAMPVPVFSPPLKAAEVAPPPPAPTDPFSSETALLTSIFAADNFEHAGEGYAELTARLPNVGGPWERSGFTPSNRFGDPRIRDGQMTTGNVNGTPYLLTAQSAGARQQAHFRAQVEPGGNVGVVLLATPTYGIRVTVGVSGVAVSLGQAGDPPSILTTRRITEGEHSIVADVTDEPTGARIGVSVDGVSIIGLRAPVQSTPLGRRAGVVADFLSTLPESALEYVIFREPPADEPLPDTGEITWVPLRMFPSDMLGVVPRGIAVAPNGDYLLGGADGVYRYSPTTGAIALEVSYPVGVARLNHVAVTPSGDILVTGGTLNDSLIYTYSDNAWDEGRDPTVVRFIGGLAVNANGHIFVSQSGFFGGMQIYQNGAWGSRIGPPAGTSSLGPLATTSDGRVIAGVTAGTNNLYYYGDGQWSPPVAGPADAAALGAQRNFGLAVTADGTILYLDAEWNLFGSAEIDLP